MKCELLAAHTIAATVVQFHLYVTIKFHFLKKTEKNNNNNSTCNHKNHSHRLY